MTFPLLVDDGASIAGSYGAYGEKKNYGRTYMGVFRKTFLIGPDGRIVRAWDKVTPKGHASEVLQALREADT